MDIFEDYSLLEFFDDLEFIRDITSFRSPRVFRERKDWFRDLQDNEFFSRFRMKKATALFILSKIENDLEFIDTRNRSIAPMQQLLITLRFYATGNFLMTVGDFGGVSKSTACRIVKRVTKAIVKLRPQFIKFPSTVEEINNYKKDFFLIHGFPNVIGCIDCTHIKIQSPGGEDAEVFRNRKGYFSLNVQTISDANLKICDVVARWPGSTHDSIIFQNSYIYSRFCNGQYPNSYLLGDSGYALNDHLLTPFLNPTTSEERKYNESHILTRNTVERQYGLLKRRFPILAVGIRLKLRNAINVIIASTILHNICIDAKEQEPPNEGYVNNLEALIANSQFEYSEQQIVDSTVRDFLVQNFFI